MDRKDLKAQALLEKISTLVRDYESQVADLRVELTIASARLEELENAKQDEGSADASDDKGN